VEWLDSDGNFVESTDHPYLASDPETAATVARLSSAKLLADHKAIESGNAAHELDDVKNLEAIRRGLVYGELTAKDAQRQAGIAEKVTLPDVFEAARKAN